MADEFEKDSAKFPTPCILISKLFPGFEGRFFCGIQVQVQPVPFFSCFIIPSARKLEEKREGCSVPQEKIDF